MVVRTGADEGTAFLVFVHAQLFFHLSQKAF